MKIINIYLDNKLISCDTITPLALEIVKKRPSIRVNFYVFDKNTFLNITRSKILNDAIFEVGKIKYFGWIYSSNKYLRKIFYIFNILEIILKSYFHDVYSFHFKALEVFPYSLIYFFNKKKTFLIENNCWGHFSVMDKIFEIFFQKKSIRKFKKYKNAVYFGDEWPQLNYLKNINKQDIYKISPTRLMKTWINFANKQKSVTKEKRVLIILGYLGKHHVYSKTTTGAELLKKTLDIVLKNTNYTVTLKPHIITDNKQLIDILEKFNTNRISISYNHVYHLALSHFITISNYASLAMPDAWIAGSNVIEYNKYDKEILLLCKNKSPYYMYVDHFINNNPLMLKTCLKSIKKIKTRKIDLFKTKKRTDDLITKICN